MKAKEIERAFLPKHLPLAVIGATAVAVEDIYLSPPNDLLNKMRLRRQGEKCELTKKVVPDPAELSVQVEFNTPLTDAEYKLFRGLGGRALAKDRYTIIDEGGAQPPMEVDVFAGSLKGLVLIEFEFPDETACAAFGVPDFCIADVTQEDFVAGAYLAGRSYAEIEPELARFGYEPIYS